MADIIGTLAGSVLGQVKGIKVETAYLPTINLSDPFAPGPPNPLLSLLKPKITIDTGGASPLVMTPYGDPGSSKWPIVALIGAAGVATMLWLAWRAWNKR